MLRFGDGVRHRNGVSGGGDRHGGGEARAGATVSNICLLHFGSVRHRLTPLPPPVFFLSFLFTLFSLVSDTGLVFLGAEDPRKRGNRRQGGATGRRRCAEMFWK
jgi:hypothetical protein